MGIPRLCTGQPQVDLHSSQQQAVNFPLPHCGLGSIQEWFTRLQILSHTLVALANLPSNVTKPLDGPRISSEIPSAGSEI